MPDLPADRPNILLITTDQQHHRLMSCAGDPHVRTPALDGLAAGGVRFARAYSPNPVCIPARYAMMTGHMPHRFDGLETNRKGREHDLPAMASCVATPPMGRLLREAGYETVYGGKLHVEGPYNISPADEKTYGFRCLTGDNRDGLAVAAAEYLRGRHGRPFFLWASFDNPHDICRFLGRAGQGRGPDIEPLPLPRNFAPTEGETRWMRGFREGMLGREEDFQLGLNRRYALAAREWDADVWGRYRAVYRHHMQVADRQIGTVLEALDDAGLAGSTVVLFTSDHGDHDAAHGLTMKRSFYEESVHVPLIVRDPAAGAPARVDDDHLVCGGPDLIPTLCDYAGIAAPADLAGRSLRPLVAGEAEVPWRDAVFSETVGGRMVRSADWKYMLYCQGENAEEQLFDMRTDPDETVNLAGDPAGRDVLAAHRGRLAQYVERENDAKGRQYLACLPSA